MKEIQLTKPYSFGAYNKSDDQEQWIRITEGCPNQCPYCAEPREFKVFPMPEIIRNKVKILDMNLIAKPEHNTIIANLPDRINNKIIYYELTCGIDYRFLDEDTAQVLRDCHFINPRIAWDWGLDQQYKIRDAIKMLLKVGYIPNDIMVFMICNWKISYEDNLKKMDLCKVWNVKIGDCWFDNQLSPNIKPIHWTAEQIKDFRHRVRKHNQLVNFKIDPEYKGNDTRKTVGVFFQGMSIEEFTASVDKEHERRFKKEFDDIEKQVECEGEEGL